jgi:hypothetical protein
MDVTSRTLMYLPGIGSGMYPMIYMCLEGGAFPLVIDYRELLYSTVLILSDNTYTPFLAANTFQGCAVG